MTIDEFNEFFLSTFKNKNHLRRFHTMTKSKYLIRSNKYLKAVRFWSNFEKGYAHVVVKIALERKALKFWEHELMWKFCGNWALWCWSWAFNYSIRKRERKKIQAEVSEKFERKFAECNVENFSALFSKVLFFRCRCQVYIQNLMLWCLLRFWTE